MVDLTKTSALVFRYVCPPRRLLQRCVVGNYVRHYIPFYLCISSPADWLAWQSLKSTGRRPRQRFAGKRTAPSYFAPSQITDGQATHSASSRMLNRGTEMKVAYLSLVFVVTVMLPMLLANSLGSRVAQPSFLMTGPGGFYPVSEDSAVHSTGSGDDLSVDDISALGWSSDSKCAGSENDCLPISGQIKSQWDHSAFSVGSYQGRGVLAFGISCAVRAEPVKVSVLWNTAGSGSLTSSL